MESPEDEIEAPTGTRTVLLPVEELRAGDYVWAGTDFGFIRLADDPMFDHAGDVIFGDSWEEVSPVANYSLDRLRWLPRGSIVRAAVPTRTDLRASFRNVGAVIYGQAPGTAPVAIASTVTDAEQLVRLANGDSP
ncbi:hypothetical protein ER308_07075 [Egibacter rhizosphaerae]|uniref:Uncharacterized protein n=1 Tax=Egibacter rhizosphaerae TaxID=1670831 RepID=A0A411YDQ1_9ACTN|nr:hypothetical protein [Egibacter rhizosphaerae]QBI19328.1 hypothetical protein ER308_07075 [Egibacter rhizosphaerae]